MSIAEQIYAGSQQQSKNWSVLADSIGRLGQQVGASLANREYQKQAAEALPAMQAAYRSAMDDVSRGSVTEGYRKFIDAQLQFGTSQNPFIAGTANNIGGEFTNFVKVLESQKQRQAQYGGRVMQPTYSLPTDEQLQSGEDFTPDVYQPQGPLPAMRDGMAPIEVDPKTGRPIVDVDMEQIPQDVEGVDRGFSFGVGAVSGGLDGGEQDFISTDELMIPANPPSKEDTQAILNWRALPPEKQDEVTNEVVVSDVPKGKGKVVSFENIPGVPFAGMVGQNKKNIPTIKREYTTEGKGKVTKESGGELNDYDTAAHNATVIGTRISGNKKLMDLFDAAGGNWNNVRISQETDEAGEPANYAFINGQKFDFPLTSAQMQKDTVPEAFGEVQMIEFIKGLPALAKVNGWKLIEQKAPAASAPAAGGLPAVLDQAPAPAAPEIPDVEGNPFAEKVKKIKTKETEEQKKVTTDEISRVVETTSRLQQALEGLAKGEYPKVMDYLPRAKKTALESSSVDALRSEYNLLASVKPAIEWLKNNPNHKDAARAAEVIRKKLGI